MPFSFLLFCSFGGFLRYFASFPLVENFVFEGNDLGVVLGELFLVLCQSINRFEGLVSEGERENV